jgi:acyl-coenzyme A thioesterase PaaI-like protein
VAEARVLRCGKHFSVVDCDVTDSAGRLAAPALMTFAYSMPEAAGGSREA